MLETRRFGLLGLALLGLAAPGRAEILLDAVWSDGAVFAADRPVVVQGRATPGAELTLTPSWGEPVVARTGEDGRFSVALVEADPGGPYSLEVSGDGEAVVHNLLAGALWLASGQSNMDWPIGATGEDALSFAPFEIDDQLRFFQVERRVALEPAADLRGAWSPCDESAVDRFSAVAHAFARRLRAELGMPVGIVQSAVGGTPVAAWTRLEALRAIEGFGEEHLVDPGAFTTDSPGSLWNSMIAPLEGHRFHGVIWYQGEHDRLDYGRYGARFRAQISDWRRAFADEALPFFFAQIAPFEYEGDLGELPRLREAQDSALNLPNTGRVVTLDLGDPADIHPSRKRAVGERFADLALTLAYGRTEGWIQEPQFRRQVFRPFGARVDLRFQSAGLVAADPTGSGGVAGFELAGEDRRFYPATGVISGSSIHLECAEVQAPVAVRYAFGRGDQGNLRNAGGLPASSWRSDDWPILPPGGTLDGERLRLSSWHAPFASPGTWSETGEVLHCTGFPTSLLVSSRSYRNYELEFDWRHLEPGGNSGLFVAADSIPAIGSPFRRGVEIQIQDGSSRPLASTHGDIFPLKGARMVAQNPREGSSRSFPERLRQQPSPLWNHLRVRMHEGRLDLWVNGVHVNTALELEPEEGFLCLESEGSPIEFRRVRVLEDRMLGGNQGSRELPRSRPVALYRGESLEPMFAAGASEAGWSARDWKIVGEGDGALQTSERLEQLCESLSTVEDPAALELTVDFRRLNAGAGPPLLLEGMETFFEELFETGFENVGQWNRLVLRFERPGPEAGLAEPILSFRALVNDELVFERRSLWPPPLRDSGAAEQDPFLGFWSPERGWKLGRLVFEAYGESLELANLALSAQR